MKLCVIPAKAGIQKILVVLFLTFASFAQAADENSFVPRIYFSSNEFVIPVSAREELSKNIEWLRQNPSAVFILEGHCDEWGEENYNLQLGDRRAREVKAAMIEEGIDPERIIMVVSFGETRPMDDRHQQEAWVKNRRVEFVLR